LLIEFLILLPDKSSAVEENTDWTTDKELDKKKNSSNNWIQNLS